MTTAITPTEPAEHDPGEDTGTPRKRPLVQRLPQAAFTTLYGTLLVGVVVGAVLVISHETDAQEPPATVERPLRPFLPPRTSQDNVGESIRPYLITDAETARTSTGVTLTGTMTDQAEADTTEFSGHVSRLLQQNCIDNMTLRTQDNMRINFWGFCYNAPPPETLQSFVDTSIDEGAQNVSFYFHPGRIFERSVWITWTEDSEEEAADVVKQWDELKLEPGLDRVYTIVYGPETVHTGSRTKVGYEVKEAPTGQAFKDKYGVPTPALGEP